MPDVEMDVVDNPEKLQEIVKQEMEQEREFVKTLSIEEVKSGDWFVKLLKRVFSTYHKNVRSEYFVCKYAGLPADTIADKLVEVNVKYATVAGGVAGALASAGQFATITSLGLASPIFMTTVGVEMVYLAHLQIKLIFDLATLYNVSLDLDDPEDVLFVFGYGMGVKTNELLGKGIQHITKHGTKTVVKSTVSKGTLKTVQALGRRVGVKILQRTLVKFFVPLASIAIGGGFNNLTTRHIGSAAKRHFSEKTLVEKAFKDIVVHYDVYTVLYPATLRYLAHVDGDFSKSEQALYETLIKRLTLDEDEEKQLQELSRDEEKLLHAITTELKGTEDAKVFFEMLVLMARADNHIDAQEQAFLQKVVLALDIDDDLDARLRALNTTD